MRRAVLFAALMAVLTAGAAVPRLASLDNRPMHCDEANQAVKFGRLLEHGHYVYDLREHHGPSLNFLTLPIAWLISAEKLTEITEVHLRLVPALFGIALVGLLWLVRDELGHGAALFAALLTAASPAMVFYSRYYIHEMLLVGFTFGAIVALWRFRRAVLLASRQCYGEGHGQDARGTWHRWWLRQLFWLVVLGLCIGMMHASKETCAIPLFAMALAAAVTIRHLRGLGAGRIAASGLVVMLTAASVSALLFSSFLDNPRGVIDSFTAYFYYLDRATGQGSVGPQAYPWYHYLQTLFWWHPPGGPVWTEAPIAALALVGLAAAALGKGLKPANLPMVRFLSIYTVLTTALYCAMPYKTPWCALGFLHGMILLAGVGAAVLIRAAPGYVLKAVAIAALVAATGHLAWQARWASFVGYDDPSNPYAHTPTARDVPLLAQRLESLAALHPDGKAMHIQVICPDDDYWPLPWYLRDFSRVGWFNAVGELAPEDLDAPVRGGAVVPSAPRGPPAPLIITQPQIEEEVLEYVYEKQLPGEPHLVQLFEKQEGVDWQLRLNVPLLVIVRQDLWDAYRANQ